MDIKKILLVCLVFFIVGCNTNSNKDQAINLVASQKYYNKAVENIKSSKVDEALLSFDKALKFFPNDEYYVLFAKELLKKDYFFEAKEYLLKSTVSEDTEPKTYLLLALTQMMLGESGPALRTAKKCLSLYSAIEDDANIKLVVEVVIKTIYTFDLKVQEEFWEDHKDNFLR